MTSLKDDLENDHAVIGGLLDAIHDAFKRNERERLSAMWSELDARLTAHLDVEEHSLIPHLQKVAPEIASVLLDDHADFRRKLLNLGVAIDLHLARAEQFRAFMLELRVHAQQEDRLLYRWAEENLPASTCAAISQERSDAASRWLARKRRRGTPGRVAS